MPDNEKSRSATDGIYAMIRRELGFPIGSYQFGRVIIASVGETLNIFLDTSNTTINYHKMFCNITNLITDMDDQGVVYIKHKEISSSLFPCYFIKHKSSMLIVAVSKDSSNQLCRLTASESIFSFSLAKMLSTLLKEISLPVPPSDLTPRQFECLKWVARGKSDWEIGQLIKRSPHTVHRHIEAAKKRLNVATRIQAVVSAGLAQSDERI